MGRNKKRKSRRERNRSNYRAPQVESGSDADNESPHPQHHQDANEDTQGQRRANPQRGGRGGGNHQAGNNRQARTNRNTNGQRPPADTADAFTTPPHHTTLNNPLHQRRHSHSGVGHNHHHRHTRPTGPPRTSCKDCLASYKANKLLFERLSAHLAESSSLLARWADDVGIGDGSTVDEMEWQCESERIVVEREVVKVEKIPSQSYSAPPSYCTHQSPQRCTFDGYIQVQPSQTDETEERKHDVLETPTPRSQPTSAPVADGIM